MERELISVIIPVYGVEAYLEKCVDSVLAQTYGELEVILVDDGSPDGCPAMCDALAAREERVRVIHKDNGGQGSARNRGLDAARGAYVGFVDSDDYIAPDMYEKLYAALRSTGADMSMCDYVHVDTQGREVKRLPPLQPGTIDSAQALERLEYAPGEWRYLSPVNRLCRRELFDGLRFPEVPRFEDLLLAHHLIARCGRITVIPDVLYMYVQTPGSSTRSPVSIRDLAEVDGYMDRYDYYRDRGLDRLTAGSVYKAYCHMWKIMTTVDAWEHRRQLSPRVRRIMAAQLRAWNHSAAVLGIRYAVELLRHMLAG